MKIPQWSPRASGSQLWLHIRITWGILTKHDCPGFVPGQLSQNLSRGTSVSIVFKAPRVILMCSPGWESWMQVNVKGPLMSEEPTLTNCLTLPGLRFCQDARRTSNANIRKIPGKPGQVGHPGRRKRDPLLSLVWKPTVASCSPFCIKRTGG